MISFLRPVHHDQQGQIPFSAHTPLHHQTLMNGNTDLSLEDFLSLSKDLSLEAPSLSLSLSHLPDDLSVDTLSKVDSTDTLSTANLSMDTLSMYSRLCTVNSNCRTDSSGSISEDLGHAIRRGMLNGTMFDSDTDHDMDCDTVYTSSDQSSDQSSVSVNVRRQGSNDSVMNVKSDTSTESSYHFDTLPANIQSCNMSTNGNEVDSNSEVATACSDEDITHLKQLCSDRFGEENEGERDDPRIPLVSAELSNLSSESLSKLESSKDDRSTQSSVVSFDSAEFLEDEQLDVPCSFDSTKFLEDDQLDVPGNPTKSKMSCSISVHDITTIHEENEDDIAQEKEDPAAQMDHARFPTPLINGELHLRRQELFSQGTTLSSVTDDSYVGCMSFDSLSQGGDPRNFRKKWEMDMGHVHQNFTMLKPPSTTHSFKDESSQFTIESSHSFSSESIKYMMDILKEETERKRSKIKERIAKIRESTERATYTSRYVKSRLKNGNGGDETSAGSSSLSL